MKSEWTESDYEDFMYSRLAMLELRRRSGIRRGPINQSDRRCERLINELKYQHPPIQLGKQLLPVVLGEESNESGG